MSLFSRIFKKQKTVIESNDVKAKKPKEVLSKAAERGFSDPGPWEMEVIIVWLATCYLIQLKLDIANDPRMRTDPDGIIAEIYQKAKTILRKTTKSTLRRNVIKAGGRYEEVWLLAANVEQFIKVNPSNKDTNHWVDNSLSSSDRDVVLTNLVDEGPMEVLKGTIWATIRAKNPYR